MPVYFDQNDNLIILTGLKNAANGAFMNSATVTVTVVDQAGDPVAGQSWPATMDYVASSDGDYRGLLEDAMVTTPGDQLTAQVTADGGVGLRGYWEEPLMVLTR